MHSVGALATVAILVAGCVPRRLPLPAAPSALGAGEVAVIAHERDVEPIDPQRVRFAAIGDLGAPSGLAVTRAAADVCWGAGAAPCDFTLLLGDNVYPDGFDGGPVARAGARDLLEALIAPLARRPTYATLGNHDWGHRFPRVETARRQLRWLAEHPARRGAAHFYRFRAAFVEVWVIDTSYLVWRPSAVREDELRDWLRGIERSDATWKIAIGHHPYVSTGEHGSAGRYRDGPLRIWPGDALRALLEEDVLDRADLYLSGHDHDLQLYASVGRTGRTAAAVIGAGSLCGGRARKVRVLPAFEHRDLGFGVVEATRERLEIAFFDAGRQRLAAASRDAGEAAWRIQVLVPEPQLECSRDANGA